MRNGGKSRRFFGFSTDSVHSTAAAEEDKKRDYDNPNSTVIVEKIAKAVIHI